MSDTLTVSNINYRTISGSTITASTIMGSTLSISRLTASTITVSTIFSATGQTALGNNVTYPNRFVEVGSDVANSMYLDFHSSDAALPDYSTRIQSLGGATTGTGNLNMYASTIGFMPTVGVGIGTTVPSAALHVAGNASLSGYPANAIALFQAATSVGVNDAGCIIGSINGNTPYISDYGSISNGLYFYTGNVLRMKIATNGNVGIGTTVSPTSNLQIYGAGGASSTTTLTITNNSNSNTGYGAQLLFNNIAGANTFSLAQISALRDNNAANYGAYMAFYTTNGDVYSTFSERMRISPAGNVGIGIANPTGTLHISGAMDGIFRLTNTNSPSWRWDTGPDSGGNYIVYTTGAVGVYLPRNGQSWVGNASDARSKTNIKSMDSVLDSLINLRPVTFLYKTDPNDTIIRSGFIAQEVDTVFPKETGWIVTQNTGLKLIDDNGQPYNPYTISMTEMIPYIVKGVQELAAENTELKSAIAAQASAIAAQASAMALLEARLAAAGL